MKVSAFLCAVLLLIMSCCLCGRGSKVTKCNMDPKDLCKCTYNDTSKSPGKNVTLNIGDYFKGT